MLDRAAATCLSICELSTIAGEPDKMLEHRTRILRQVNNRE